MQMARMFQRRRRQRNESHSIRSYRDLVSHKLRRMPENRSLALAQAIGSPTMDIFASQGDGHVAVLRHHGLADGMALYDLGCGCGRTAQALQRSGWRGSYTGADVVPELLAELARQCPDYATVLNPEFSVAAPDASLDMLFHWSVFTHLYPAECQLYMADTFRALKPGGRLVFSFLELEDPAHHVVFETNLVRLRKGEAAEQLDAFLHRDWIRHLARGAGFGEPHFTAGDDETAHQAFWQSLAVMEKPQAVATH